jgi:hypothetical protein
MEENRIKFYELVNTFYDNPKTVLNYLENKDAFTQPASTRTHLAVRGGWCQHCLNVFKILTELNKHFKLFSEKEVCRIATGHDFCKPGIYFKNPKYNETYNPNDEPPYILKDPFPMGHGEKSMLIMQRLEPTISELELLCIRWHWYVYDPSYSKYSYQLTDFDQEISLTYYADNMAAKFLEGYEGPKFPEEWWK